MIRPSTLLSNVLLVALSASWCACTTLGQTFQDPAGQNSTGLPAQPQSSVEPLGPQPAVAGNVVGPGAMMARPDWVNQPLPPEHQSYLDQLLSIWEGYCQKVGRYRCKFTRWQYVPEFCSWRDPQTDKLAAFIIAEGNIRYAAPERGMYEVDRNWHFAPPTEPEAQPDYTQHEDPKDRDLEREKWICDGRTIYEFDFRTNTLYDTPLPPEMQGAGLRNSPLPFVFGAQADELKERFWLRIITPQGAPEDEYWLEAVPKRIEDARVYQKVEIILSREPFLPKAVHIYDPNYEARRYPKSTFFLFEDRQLNNALDNVTNFLGWFIRPQTPFGWERKERIFPVDRSEQTQQALGETPWQDQVDR